MHITENSANELQKVIDEKLDIPLSSEPDASTTFVVMKRNSKVNDDDKSSVHWMLVQILMTALRTLGAE